MRLSGELLAVVFLATSVGLECAMVAVRDFQVDASLRPWNLEAPRDVCLFDINFSFIQA